MFGREKYNNIEIGHKLHGHADSVLTVELIDDAMKSSDFFCKDDSVAAFIVNTAHRMGYVNRYSVSQVQWTDEGLALARAELAWA